MYQIIHMRRFALAILLLCSFLYAQTITLENAKAKLVIAIKGSTISSMGLKSQTLNPIHSYGDFLCFDRWGPSADPSIPQHGEASKTVWTIDKPVTAETNAYSTTMSCVLPLAKLKISRTLKLDKNAAVFTVTETISNPNPNKQMFNIVEHVTLGAPFLDTNTIVNTKVEKGFWQSGVIPPVGNAILGWPQITLGSQSFDARYQRSGKQPVDYVISYVIAKSDSFGWVTACNPSKKLLIGYIWRTTEMPWLNLWASTTQIARGLEFGTGGLHQTVPNVISSGPIFDRPICEYVSPDSPIVKSYTGFLSEIPTTFKGVDQILFLGGKITIKEYNGTSTSDIVIPFSMNPTSLKPTSKNTQDSRFTISLKSPNARSNEMHIRYYLATPEHVSIDLYSLQGKKILLLFKDFQDKGNHTVIQNSKQLQAGVYLCQLRIGGNEFHKEIILGAK